MVFKENAMVGKIESHDVRSSPVKYLIMKLFTVLTYLSAMPLD